MVLKLLVPLVLLTSAPAQQVDAGSDGLINPALNLAENVHLGANPAIQGNAGTQGGTVIQVTKIPEPATLGMMVIGGLAFLRRRR